MFVEMQGIRNLVNDSRHDVRVRCRCDNETELTVARLWAVVAVEVSGRHERTVVLSWLFGRGVGGLSILQDAPEHAVGRDRDGDEQERVGIVAFARWLRRSHRLLAHVWRSTKLAGHASPITIVGRRRASACG